MATVFEVHGPMAMFRKPYTTTSSVSYAFPPPTAVGGLIGAIMGIKNNSHKKASNADYWEQLKGTRIAISIKRETKWLRQSLNFWNVKEPQKNPHIQVKHQFLSNPRYRIYVSGELEERLDSFLRRDAFVYTPCLGVAYALAEVDYIGRYDLKDPEGDVLNIDTVIPWSDGMSIDVLGSGGAFKEQIPFKMDVNRSLMSTSSVVYSVSPDKKLLLKERGDCHVSLCGEDLVAWFPSW